MTIKTITVVEKELKLDFLTKELNRVLKAIEDEEIKNVTYVYEADEFELDINELLVRLFTERVTVARVQETISKAYSNEINRQVHRVDEDGKTKLVGIAKILNKFIDDLDIKGDERRVI